MIRIVLENVLLFLLPAAIYFAYVLVARQGTTSTSATLNEAPLVWLFSAGAALVFIVLFMFSNTSGGKPGQAYEPPVFRDGQIEPGRSR